jgi:hypothetical protein
MSEPWGISIIVVNFNYKCSLSAAIDSALSQKHRFRRFANRRTTPRQSPATATGQIRERRTALDRCAELRLAARHVIPS